MLACTRTIPPVQCSEVLATQVWSEVDNLLYFVDIDGKAVHSYNPSTGRDFKVDTPAKAAAVSASITLSRQWRFTC